MTYLRSFFARDTLRSHQICHMQPASVTAHVQIQCIIARLGKCMRQTWCEYVPTGPRKASLGVIAVETERQVFSSAMRQVRLKQGLFVRQQRQWLLVEKFCSLESNKLIMNSRPLSFPAQVDELDELPFGKRLIIGTDFVRSYDSDSVGLSASRQCRTHSSSEIASVLLSTTSRNE